MKKCALYTRVSTAMQAEKEYNSCEAQKDRILSFIKSQEGLELAQEYSDPGFSGGSLDRPALKALLRDIKDKKIDEVLTYKIDRLTRSSKDFYSLIEFFEKHNVSYVSVTERFDTSSPSGRLLRNIMLTFAQFEREMIVERTRDKMLARAQKGLWNGGGIPLGFKIEKNQLVVNKEKAKQVKDIFETYVTTQSLTKTLNFCKEKDIRTGRKNLPMSLNTLWNILRNSRYIGYMQYTGKFYKAQHESIISNELFELAKNLRQKKIIKKRLYKEFFLSGRVKCTECLSNMTPSFSNKKTRRYYYYKCYKIIRDGAKACSTKEVNAEKLETFLIENLSRLAQDKQYLENLAFKKAYEMGVVAGFELPKLWPQELVTSVSQVLIEFKNKIENATQVEKCLIFQRTIKETRFSKDSLEVILNIKDMNDTNVDELLSGGSGKMAVRMREGAANSDASACIPSSILKNGVSSYIPRNSCFDITTQPFKWKMA